MTAYYLLHLFTCPELVRRTPEQRGGCHGEWECYADAHEFGDPLQGGAHIPESEAGNSFCIVINSLKYIY